MRSGSLRRRCCSATSFRDSSSASRASSNSRGFPVVSFSRRARFDRYTFGRYLATQASDPAAVPATAVTPEHAQAPLAPVVVIHQQQPMEMELPLLYRYLRLETFTEQELRDVFDRIRDAGKRSSGRSSSSSSVIRTELYDDQDVDYTDDDESSDEYYIDAHDLQKFFLQRYSEFEQEFSDLYQTVPDDTTNSLRQQQAYRDTQAFLQVFSTDDKRTTNVNTNDDASLDSSTATLLPFHSQGISERDFSRIIRVKASRVDLPRTLPITASMLLVGASVGVITPAMPFVVENLGLTTSQYGMVVSAFGLAKMAGNIPSAIAVERHGRKPYLTYSLAVIAMGVGGLGLASSVEELYVCRLLTGLGVAALSTGGTMMITDLSTPLNRASTMAPVMSAFAAGTALGPALGGMLVDQVGLNPTFYIVGVSYLGVAVINKHLLKETKSLPIHFSWQQRAPKSVRLASAERDTVSSAVRDAVGQWVPLLQDAKIRNVLIMQGFYWVALAGAQMTLLPLILTDVDGLAMTATQLGSVYMGMSLVQIFANPLIARYIDQIGKAPAIVAGCTLISTAMIGLPFCEDVTQLAGVLGIWSMGSSMLSTAPLAYVSDKVSEAKRAQAIALLRTCGDVGFLVGASGAGALADWAGSLDVAMHSSAGLLLTATGWFATRQLLTAQLAGSSATTTSTTTRRNTKEL
jgi:MFS family permease